MIDFSMVLLFGRNNAKAEILVLWPPHAKSWLIGKDSDAGRDWGQEEKGTTEDEMAGWHHWPNGPESGWIPGAGDGQGVLACCDSWGRKESDTTERLNWTDGIAHPVFSRTTCFEVEGTPELESWAEGWPCHVLSFSNSNLTSKMGRIKPK